MITIDVRTYVFHPSVMKRTAASLRANLYETLDYVATTGKPVEVRRGDVRLQIIRVEKKPKTQPRVLTNLIVGSPDDLIHCTWPWSAK